MAAISSVITFIAQRAGGAVAALQSLPLWERICNAAISYCRYVRIMFWPDPLRPIITMIQITSEFSRRCYRPLRSSW